MFIITDSGIFYSSKITFNCNIVGKKDNTINHKITCISNIKNPNLCFGKITHNLKKYCVYTGKIMLHFNTNEEIRYQYCFFDVETIEFYLNKIRQIVYFEYILKKSNKYSCYYDLQITIKNLNSQQLYFILNMIRRLYTHPQAEFLKEAIEIHKKLKYNLFDLLLIGDRLDTVTHHDSLLYVSPARKIIRVTKNRLANTTSLSLSHTLTSTKRMSKKLCDQITFFRSSVRSIFCINSNKYKRFLKNINQTLQLIYKSLQKC